jgi:hypothetical protein
MPHLKYRQWLPVVGIVLVLLASVACAAPSDRASDVSDVTFVIPAGTEAALERDDAAAFHFPDPIQVQAGQTVVITNHDHAMHYFFDMPIAPGETIRKPFPRPGMFVYDGGLSCSLSGHGAIMVQVV